MKKWSYFLKGKHFIWRTDHSALTAIHKMELPEKSHTLVRWLETLAGFDFKVVYRPGRLHSNADALSRAEHIGALFSKDIADKIFEETPGLTALKTWVQAGKWPDAVDPALAPEVSPFKPAFEKLQITDKKLFFKIVPFIQMRR